MRWYLDLWHEHWAVSLLVQAWLVYALMLLVQRARRPRPMPLDRERELRRIATAMRQWEAQRRSQRPTEIPPGI